MAFVVLEGGDGGGKTTQLNLLREKFPDFVFTKEPGGTPYADKIRALMLDAAGKDASGRVMFGLIMASRFDHIEKFITPALAAGKTVFSDRYMSSSYAYQIVAPGCSDLIPVFEDYLKLIPLPDLTLVLEVDPRVGRARITPKRSIDHFEARDSSFHERVREAYRTYAGKYAKGSCVFVNASRSIEAVHDDVLASIRNVLM
ncbi:MAG: dTMP kinase [Minisyncoccia bacterium]